MPDLRVKLAIVIINYKTPHLVIDCLQSFLQQLENVNACVVLVDNCSPDDSADILKKWIDTHDDRKVIRFIEATTNTGFAGGNNIGIRSVEAEYYLLLNSDTIVRPGAIAVLLETAESHREAGIISPRLEWPDGTPQESCFRYLTPASEFIDAAQSAPITALLKRFNVPLPVSDTMVSPDWTSFACALVRNEVFNEVGLLDEGFFLYFDDVEYCYRARSAGWDILHNPKARVVHLRGKSSPVKQRAIERKRLPSYYYASRAHYFFVAHGRLGLTLANLFWTLGRLISKSREILEHRGPGLPERQWLDIWTNWLHPGTSAARSRTD